MWNAPQARAANPSSTRAARQSISRAAAAPYAAARPGTEAMSGSSYWPRSAVYVHGTAPFSRIHATATEVSRPPEKAIPTRSPTGREVSTLDTLKVYAQHCMIMQPEGAARARPPRVPVVPSEHGRTGGVGRRDRDPARPRALGRLHRGVPGSPRRGRSGAMPAEVGLGGIHRVP